MIYSYAPGEHGLVRTEGLDPSALWFELFQPSVPERKKASEMVGYQLPSLEVQEEIEHSSRFYVEKDAPVMTLLVPVRQTDGTMRSSPVTFLLTATQLVTIRHQAHGAFATYLENASRASNGVATPARVLLGLLGAIIDRVADATEQIGRDIEVLMHSAFRDDKDAAQTLDQKTRLRQIGRYDTVVMSLRESLVLMERMLEFLAAFLAETRGKDDARRTMKSLQRDVRAIREQTNFLSQKTALLLDATLGMIEIEQSHIVKIFSVVAALFLPPTLIASIYGMNFEHMDILAWRWGYPFMLVLMLLSAVVPLWWFRRKGWL
ncbi:magnesium transporter CorA family protein [Albibacillus kandeliae]|uniref:magnesium transporter CorA family protein n=1 Tax=Albibacillus kandeliae TaxID=2174228 RepID=UPI000D687196|nr:magnesium transporter CorA family protein [Albibacillus kandeliae]